MSCTLEAIQVFLSGEEMFKLAFATCHNGDRVQYHLMLLAFQLASGISIFFPYHFQILIVYPLFSWSSLFLCTFSYYSFVVPLILLVAGNLFCLHSKVILFYLNHCLCSYLSFWITTLHKTMGWAIKVLSIPYSGKHRTVKAAPHLSSFKYFLVVF